MTEYSKSPMEVSIAEMMADPARRKRLLEASERALEEKITEQFKWSLPDAVGAVCTKFIEEEVAPAVAAHLQKNKGAIMQAAIAAADEIGAKIAEEMVSKATKNMTGYRMGELMKGLFA